MFDEDYVGLPPEEVTSTVVMCDLSRLSRDELYAHVRALGGRSHLVFGRPPLQRREPPEPLRPGCVGAQVSRDVTSRHIIYRGKTFRFLPACIAMWTLALLLAASITRAGGHSTYQSLVPNGHTVPCPPGVFVFGCIAGVCHGFGHTQCAGGGAANSFGQAFTAAGNTWTQKLCRADSDGDGASRAPTHAFALSSCPRSAAGISNGEELGDPCCTWKVGATPNHPAVSHPGFASSTARPAPRCGASGSL